MLHKIKKTRRVSRGARSSSYGEEKPGCGEIVILMEEGFPNEGHHNASQAIAENRSTLG